MMINANRYPIARVLVDPGTGLVRFLSLQETHDFLSRNQFRLVDKEPHGAGHHLFYLSGDCLVRIKTHGDPSGPRQDQAHLSVASWSGSLEYESELGKADQRGLVRAAPSKKDLTAYSLWAHATHFNFKSRHLAGAERLFVRFGSA
jgi:hypothetical protein